MDGPAQVLPKTRAAGGFVHVCLWCGVFVVRWWSCGGGNVVAMLLSCGGSDVMAVWQQLCDVGGSVMQCLRNT